MPNLAEEQRLREARIGVPWRRWGPYLSERQWGTVREDYSDDGDASSYLSHDQARSRADRWGEDGLAGVWLGLALALWNEQDPILKERLFGLTNSDSNHGEDVKEYYFYLDNLPTHAYQRWLYKYPQGPYPYNELIEGNRRRSRIDMEYELLDTGVFEGDRYFDVEVEHAKAGTDDIVCRTTVHNRGPSDAPIRLFPTLWFRNTWSWPPHDPRPTLRRIDAAHPVIRAEHHELDPMFLHTEPGAALLFCENESNAERLWGAEPTTPFPKYGINDHIVRGTATVNPAEVGTKAAAHVPMTVPAGDAVWCSCGSAPTGPTRSRPRVPTPTTSSPPGGAEADAFYESITPPSVSDDAGAVMRQALAGMLWSKQCYYFDLDLWLRERHAHPLRSPRSTRSASTRMRCGTTKRGSSTTCSGSLTGTANG